MSLAKSLVLVAVPLSILAAPRAAHATEDDATDSVARAQADLDEAGKALSQSGSDCITRCKALQSMARAADRICALGRDGDQVDKKRCEDARARVAEATKIVQTDCPTCAPPTPTPNTSTGTATTPPQPTTPEEKAPASTDATYAQSVSSVRELSRAKNAFTLTLSPLRLILPPVSVRATLEAHLYDGLSLMVFGGAGKTNAASSSTISTTGPTVSVGDAGDKVSTWEIGGALRWYFAHRFEGAFAGVDVTYVHATANPVSAGFLVRGLTVGPVVGYKLITSIGFTVDTRVGLGVVAKDDRDVDPSSPRSNFVPLADVGIGWSF